MACYYPLHAYKGPYNSNGKIQIVWSSKDSLRGVQIDLPCGKCVGCQLERSRQWAIRCMHESSLYNQNCFLTLTYDDGNLPDGSSLVLKHFQLFMKKLRNKFLTPKPGIRFFHCGEYGEALHRPHYHCLLFNFDFPDKIFLKKIRKNTLYTSEILSKLWGRGFASIGSVTFESAAYVARYVLKKVYGDDASKHYNGRKPEYITMSRRPGIGSEWFDRFGSEVFPNDDVIVSGKQARPPKFYADRLEKSNPAAYAALKKKRAKEAIVFASDDQELMVKEIIKIASMRGRIQRSL